MGFGILNQHLVNWLNFEAKPSETPLCDYERIRYELKPCDVILVEGRSRVSNVIRLITSSPWTHAALYVGRLHDIEDPNLRETVAQYYPCESDTQIVIESMLGHGTVVNSLSEYKNDHLRICRPKGLSYKDAHQVVRYAISRLGAEYDVRQIFDLARFLFPWFLLPRRWRSSLFSQHVGRTTRTVCSTMIAEAFGFIQFPILPLVKQGKKDEGLQLFRRNPKLCVPRDFDYSPYFEIIKYPFVDFNLSSEYRLLPWRGNGALSGEEAELYLAQADHFTDTPGELDPSPFGQDQTTKGSPATEGKHDDPTTLKTPEGQGTDSNKPKNSEAGEKEREKEREEEREEEREDRTSSQTPEANSTRRITDLFKRNPSD